MDKFLEVFFVISMNSSLATRVDMRITQASTQQDSAQVPEVHGAIDPPGGLSFQILLRMLLSGPAPQEIMSLS